MSIQLASIPGLRDGKEGTLSSWKGGHSQLGGLGLKLVCPLLLAKEGVAILWPAVLSHGLSVPFRADKLQELISSHDLFVLQVEMDVYTMTKRVRYWINKDVCHFRVLIRGAPV